MFFVKPFVKLNMLFIKLFFGKFNCGLDFSVKDRFIQKGGCEVGMMVASAEIVMFSLDPVMSVVISYCWCRAFCKCVTSSKLVYFIPNSSTTSVKVMFLV